MERHWQILDMSWKALHTYLWQLTNIWLTELLTFVFPLSHMTAGTLSGLFTIISSLCPLVPATQ